MGKGTKYKLPVSVAISKNDLSDLEQEHNRPQVQKVARIKERRRRLCLIHAVEYMR